MSVCSLTSRRFRQKVGQVPVVKGKMSRAVADAPAAKAIETQCRLFSNDVHVVADAPAAKAIETLLLHQFHFFS